MRRSVHIWTSLLAVLLLLKPFDCFSASKFTQKAADCCRKGKCVPSSNADDCCKGTLPGGKQLVAAKDSVHQAPVLEVAITVARVLPPPPVLSVDFAQVHSPPGSPPISSFRLPLLI